MLLAHAFNTQPGSLHSTSAFASCLPNTSSSARGENLGPLQVFHEHAHSPGNTHRPKYEHGLLDYQEHIRAFPSPPWTPHSPTFLNFLVSPLFAQLLPSASNHFSILESKCLEDFRTFQIWPIQEGREFNPRKGNNFFEEILKWVGLKSSGYK